MNNQEIAQQVLKNLGGENNVITCTHCATRLRFTLKDIQKAQTATIEKLPSVISVVKAAGQYQIVFGPKVIDIYNAMSDILHMNKQSEETKPQHKNIFDALIDLVSSIFTPILYVLIGSGIIKGLLSIFTSLKWMSATSGTYEIFNAAGDSLYYFLPMILAITCAQKFKTNLFVSITIGGALVYPNIAALYGKTIQFMHLPIEIATFKSSVFPIIFAIFTLSYLEKVLKKVIPTSVESIFEPLISLLILVPLTIIVFGPIGSALADGIASFYMYLYGLSKVVAGGFIGFFAQAMVVFGIHWGLFPIIFSNIQKYGFDTILAVFGPSIISQSGAALGIFLRTKDSNMKKIASSATLMGFFGISEPAIYGVTVKYKRAFLMAMIGGGIGGAIAGAAGSRATAVAVASVPSFPVYFGHGFAQFVIGYFMAFAIAAILTYFFGYDSSIDNNKQVIADTLDSQPAAYSSNSNQQQESWAKQELVAPVDGKTIPLADVDDEVFSSESLGKGAAFLPILTTQKVIAPIAGVVTATYPSMHAYGITCSDGRQYLIHIGINTVDLNGKYFTNGIVKDTKVKQGDELCTVDFASISAAGYDSCVIITLLNSTAKTKVLLNADSSCKIGQSALTFSEN
ncbi:MULTISPECIES: beta-glucoside-specific PTS transporter subunit IIABC [unclassified Lactobacillus]|uniref:beta-glucoside-specific PTS transporter subunit IIABC n=1 Tax=unclassified Lactobacillus TaxID=2620435 RepID=UPI000EFB96A5|nr:MULTISPECIES: beta-glucoside-specific PTS transporter subunit IIABC [unclassified Lactobacillus]RMC38625.1 PTS beta-glucoside transporter subunit EIIBCA [Lactobacillus sp. ESL0237]RMC42970.1 PTS beta-glucoside transporter subunit EIIBCA [Lactobacillus sp. ESL0234]RMC43824.1 PTS beta-glucoside transporter subunit EIIBCA [Lactobacillus sp. ESL0236]RMC48073.1 PTS beta-glucoside transporter subunit EIIBCA [Lactobacillus sp. ESL0225]